jgi:hypothetical protein
MDPQFGLKTANKFQCCGIESAIRILEKHDQAPIEEIPDSHSWQKRGRIEGNQSQHSKRVELRTLQEGESRDNRGNDPLNWTKVSRIFAIFLLFLVANPIIPPTGRRFGQTNHIGITQRYSTFHSGKITSGK